MNLEEIIQREIENIIEKYLEDYKEEIDENADYHITMIKVNLYIAINEIFYTIRRRFNDLKNEEAKK